MTTTKPTTREDWSRRILRVLVHIQENLDSVLPLDELARVACFSPFHFHRVFRGMVGESVAQHVRRLRLERAVQRLLHTDRPVTRIAFEAGYEAHESFTRAFHAAFGCSPSAFRGGSNRSTRVETSVGVHWVSASGNLAFEPLSLEDHPMDVQIREIAPLRVAFLRHIGPYHEVGETWSRLMDWVGAECLFGPDTKLFGACWDDPEVTPPEKIRYDACVTIGETAEPPGEIGLQTLGGGRFAVVLHEGPYENLSRTYDALMGRWFAGSPHEPGDVPSLEFYLNDPDSTEPEDLLTEVCVRICE